MSLGYLTPVEFMQQHHRLSIHQPGAVFQE
jgi:hypothetical protein